MGYYDDHYLNNQQNEQKQSKKRTFVTALIGAIVGGFIVLAAIPLLVKIGYIPSTPNFDGTRNVLEEKNSSNETVTETVNISVNSDVIEAVEKVSDAVVGVINIRQSSFWTDETNEGTGSGVIYKVANDKAFVVTNHHVISGANQIEVSLTDGTRVSANLLGSDILTDLAVLEIDAKHVKTVAEFGNSENLRVGEPAIAIGNPLGLRFSSSVTQGIISATERSIPVDLTGDGQIDWHAEVIQTDAAINPGNSGGALINIQGQVIGINSMKIAQSAVEGIGFAIPTAIAVPVINDLERFGEVQRPQMGVGIRSLSEIPGYHWQQTLKLPASVKAGVIITSVQPMSPADRSGLKQYDVIVEMDGNPIENSHDLRKYLYTKKKIGDEVELTIYRDGKKQKITLQLTERQTY